MRHIEPLLLLALWALLIRAFPAHQEEDKPPQWTYVPSPRTRGTWTILSTSCTALIASTWSALHLNIPKLRQDGDQSWKDRVKNIIRDSVLPIKWTVAAIIAPESLAGFAFSDWMHARKTESLLKMYGKGKIQSWDRTQIHFANMGGFVFRFQVLAIDSEEYNEKYDEETRKVVLDILEEFRQSGILLFVGAIRKLFGFISFSFRTAIDKIAGLYRNDKEASQNPSDRTHGLGASSAIELRSAQGLGSTNLPLPSPPEVETEAASPVDPIPSPTSNAHKGEGVEPIPTASASRGDAAHILHLYDQIPTKQINIYLNGTQILLAQRLGILKEPPEILTREIEDKSKNTPFGKIFLALPLVVLTYIVIARISKNLPVSQLEFAVCAYSICTIFASVFYWSKPQSVGVPRISSSGQLRPVVKNDQRTLSLFGGTSFIETNFFPPFGADPDQYFRKITKNISNDNVVGNFCWIFRTTLHNADLASVLVGTIFGALYCLCWNSVFPTAAEKYLWRVSSVVVTSGLIPYALANAFFTIKYKESKTHTDIRQIIWLSILLSCYILARIFFIWEMFWTLFYQPKETFQNLQGL